MGSEHARADEWPGSSFAGLWVDGPSAHADLARRVADGRVPGHLQPKFAQFIDDGYTILERAVPADVCAAVRRTLADGWRHGSERLLVQEPGAGVAVPLHAGVAPDRMRVVDMHAVDEHARRALFSESIVEYLTALFQAPPHLFQSLTFERGSQQGLHQDTAYVVVSEPRHLAACWIALEDIEEGSGELTYVPGSHRLPEFLFSGAFKHWSPVRDGNEQHDAWATYLREQTAALGMSPGLFRPKTGDVLVWHSDLVHGGGPVLNPESTRRSLVGHYCPATAQPNYYSHAPDRRAVRRYGSGSYSSYHVDLESVAG